LSVLGPVFFHQTKKDVKYNGKTGDNIMTKIFGTNSGVGDWMMSPFTNGDAERMSRVRESIDQSDLVEARSEIEKCAESGETFYFGSDTPDSIKKNLSEYAEAVGLSSESMQQVDSNSIRTSKKVVDAISDAAPEGNEAAPEPLFDIIPTIPTNPDVFAKNDSWNKSQAAQSMEYRPEDNGVVPIRGGEEYEKNPEKGVRSGENSIADPEAIDSLASSSEKTSLETIREGNEQRKATGFDRDSWESEVASKMRDSNILPSKGARMVESPQSQNHTSSGKYRESIMSDSDLAPDKTVGETIPELNEKRASEIKREKEEDDWERMESSVGNMVTDVFYESLQKNLDKMNGKDKQ
jgi:hypothetical protein